ncbi:MAG TPA: NAD-dependent epimerase/dehydratase family protein [Ktedonobacterales bacterium]|nr:NAD-dependent epimerase/dehydratase family protein [Ktedonobacterales bacterium]
MQQEPHPLAGALRFQTILITGGAGFVGSNLAIWLKSRYPATHIIAADNLRRGGSETNLPRLREHGIEFVHCDIRNPEDLRLERRPIDLILECSAEPSVLAGYADAPDYVINTNLVGTINCLELARRCGASVVFLSTSRVYPIATLNTLAWGETDTRFVLSDAQSVLGASAHGIAETFPLEGARSLYGTTKLCSELLIQEYGAMYGIPYIINRCGVLTGPWQMGKVDQGVFTLWVAMHYFQRDLSYIGWGGAGKQVRDLLHIADLADLLDIQLGRFAEFSGMTFNVGGGVASSLSLCETTELCQEITGHTIPIQHVDVNRPADLALYITDHRRITQATGWAPRRTPRETLAAIYDWIRSAEPLVRHIWAG